MFFLELALETKALEALSPRAAGPRISRACLEGFSKISRRFLEDFSRISRGFLEDFSRFLRFSRAPSLDAKPQPPRSRGLSSRGSALERAKTKDRKSKRPLKQKFSRAKDPKNKSSLGQKVSKPKSPQAKGL